MTLEEFKAEAGRKIDNWIVELEKGEIKPLQSLLSNDSGTAMCCLGVYLHTRAAPRDGEVFVDQGVTVRAFPTSGTMREIGLTDVGGLLDGDLEFPADINRNPGHGIGLMETLSQLNDWGGLTDFSPVVATIKLNRERMIEAAADAWARRQRST